MPEEQRAEQHNTHLYDLSIGCTRRVLPVYCENIQTGGSDVVVIYIRYLVAGIPVDETLPLLV